MALLPPRAAARSRDTLQSRFSWTRVIATVLVVAGHAALLLKLIAPIAPRTPPSGPLAIRHVAAIRVEMLEPDHTKHPRHLSQAVLARAILQPRIHPAKKRAMARPEQTKVMASANATTVALYPPPAATTPAFTNPLLQRLSEQRAASIPRLPGGDPHLIAGLTMVPEGSRLYRYIINAGRANVCHNLTFLLTETPFQLAQAGTSREQLKRASNAYHCD